MIKTFLETLTPMLTLFICMAIGFALRILKILPKSAGEVMSKLLVWVFCPAISFSSMAKFFTVETIGVHLTNLLLGSVGAIIAIGLAIFIAGFIIKKKSNEQGVYQYALAFGNSGYVGEPIVMAIFGDVGLFFYKICCLPINIAIYTWGLKVLTPKDIERKSALKGLFNAPMVALFIGIIVGITGLGDILYSSSSLKFFTNSVDMLKDCMGPVAMLLAGLTVANYSLEKMFKNKKVYIATLFRLVIIPIILIAVMFGIKELVNLIFSLTIDNSVLFLLFFAWATPLGLNTVVFPEAYGGDPSTGASMAMISHTLCVISIPLMYALMVFVFGSAPIF